MFLKVVKENRERDLKCIGIGHVKKRGAVGHLAALKEGSNVTVGFEYLIMLNNHRSTWRSEANINGSDRRECKMVSKLFRLSNQGIH